MSSECHWVHVSHLVGHFSKEGWLFMQDKDTHTEQQLLSEFVDDPGDEETPHRDDLAEQNARDIEHLREILESTVDHLTQLTEKMEHVESPTEPSTEPYEPTDDTDVRGFQ